MNDIRTLILHEYKPLFLGEHELTKSQAEAIYITCKDQVEIEWPSLKTDGKWKITSQGWVGYIPLSDELHLSLQPKVSLQSLFGMLEYAYDVNIELASDLFQSESLLDFYNRLARILSKLVLDRAQRGIHRDYVSTVEPLSYLRERLELETQLRAPWKVELSCLYHEHTPDIEENQILVWTLYRIACSGMCTNDTINLVRKAFYTLGGSVSLKSLTAHCCINRLYHRLNQDYRPMHALCRFFLEQSGPGYRPHDHKMIPFLIDMNLLFERFVARWLETHLPSDKILRVQESATIDQENKLRVQIDMVLANSQTSEILCVMDTKYKIHDLPSSSDLEQVIAYADIMNCTEAVLVYPGSTKSISKRPGRTRVKTLNFDITQELEQAGKTFLAQLLQY